MNLKYKLNVNYILCPGMGDKYQKVLSDLKIAEKSRSENGCLYYNYSEILSDENSNDMIILTEIWADKQSRARHLDTEHIKQLAEIKDKYVKKTVIQEENVYFPDEILRPDNDRCSVRTDGIVTVPGSKSMTNRALLLAALSDSESRLNGVLFSDDSRHFLDSLKSLGFKMKIDEKNSTVFMNGTGGTIPHKSGSIDVGSAGTAARFLTAMLALSDGEYVINCSDQMKKRPMKPLLDVLESMGAEFEYICQNGFLPVKVKGCGLLGSKRSDASPITVNMDISKSTQFLSAMLMISPRLNRDVIINVTSEKKTGAYIDITVGMLESFGAHISFNGNSYYVKCNQKITLGDYYIEPDVSAACYFYAAAALTGGRVTVRNVFYSSVQGDLKFLELLKTMGCRAEETPLGICVEGTESGHYKGVDIDMNNFSDQALTFAVLAAFADTPTVIRNVGHIRGQECDRMNAIVKNLKSCGVDAYSTDSDIYINPTPNVHGAVIDTFEDHRVAMSFNLMSLRTEGIIIENPLCCRKTFENYFDVFEELITQ